MAGLGLLTTYLLDPAVEEININGYETVEIIRPSGTTFLYGAEAFTTPTAALDVVKRMVRMNDAYRADRVLILDAASAEADFRAFVSSDFPSRYTVTIQTVTATASPPALTATGTIFFPTIFSQYGFRDLTFSFAVRAMNYDLD